MIVRSYLTILMAASLSTLARSWVGTPAAPVARRWKHSSQIRSRWGHSSKQNSQPSQKRSFHSHLSAFQSFRYSNEEFSPLNAKNSSTNTTDETLVQPSMELANNNPSPTIEPSFQNGVIDPLLVAAATAASNSNGAGEHSETNLNVPVPPLKAGQMASVLGVDPADVQVVLRNNSIANEKPAVLSVTEMFQNSHFVDMFRGSANYIANHRDSTIVFHIPGDWIDHEDPDIFRDLMNDISLTWLLGIKIVIVVGCSYQVEKRVNDRIRHLGMVVTDSESLRVVKEEAGYVRFEVERQLARSLQSSRASLDGNVVSGNFYSAQPFGVLDGVDYKYSGFVRRLESEKVQNCLANRDIVLLTTLGVSPTGEVFNVNSEYLAAYVGGSLKASKLIYFMEEDIELRHRVHGSKIPHLRSNDARNLLVANDISTVKKGFVIVGDDCPCGEGEQNMLVKIGWSMKALEKGVKRVHIITPENGALLQELYTRDGSGTMISGDLYDGIQQAKIQDVNGIHELIAPLIQQGTLVDRPKDVLERDISQYHVYTRDDLIVACGQLKMFENGYAEIGCLVVSAAYRARGRGDAMLGYLERLCVQKGASAVFVLSTQTMEWFVERGFAEVPVEMLPPSRQALYNPSRASKIYMKKITSVRDLDASELFWNR